MCISRRKCFSTFEGTCTWPFLLNRKFYFLFNKKRSAVDAHSRDMKYVAKATALGASVSQARHFLIRQLMVVTIFPSLI